MIISHKHKFVLMHNPKTAGTSIRKAIEHLHDDESKNWHQGWEPNLDRVVDLAHLTFHDLLVSKPTVNWREYTFLTIVRNPYERFISGLTEHFRQHPEEFARFTNIDDWTKLHMDETNFRFNWRYIHLCPQHYFVPPFDGGYDFRVEAYEDLDAAWKWVKERLHLDPDLTLPVTRQRVGIHNVGALGPGATRQIDRVYAEDFWRLNYTRRTVDPALPATHYERMNAIHSPYMLPPRFNDCYDGEQIAFNQVYHQQHRTRKSTS
jgi:hypothetical protein